MRFHLGSSETIVVGAEIGASGTGVGVTAAAFFAARRFSKGSGIAGTTGLPRPAAVEVDFFMMKNCRVRYQFDQSFVKCLFFLFFFNASFGAVSL